MIDFNAMSAPGGMCKTIPPFSFGSPTDIPLVGDWTGKGYDSVGVYRPSTATFYLKNTNTAGNADITYVFGMPYATPIVFHGDNGVDHIGVVKDGTFYMRWAHSTGVADNTFAFGSPGDVPIMGDWTGLGTQTAGIFRSGVFYLIYKNEVRNVDKTFSFGTAGDIPLVGDWTARQIETVGLFRNGTFYFSNTNMTSPPTETFNYGQAGDIPLVGSWDTTPGDSVGVFRNGTFYLLSGIGCTPFVCDKYKCEGTTRIPCNNNTWGTPVPNDTYLCGYVAPVCTSGTCDGMKTYTPCDSNGQWGISEPKSPKCGWECDDGKCDKTTLTRTPCINNKWGTPIPNSDVCGYNPNWDVPDTHGCYPNRSREEYRTTWCDIRKQCIYSDGECPVLDVDGCTSSAKTPELQTAWCETTGKCQRPTTPCAGYTIDGTKLPLRYNEILPECTGDHTCQDFNYIGCIGGKKQSPVPNSPSCGYECSIDKCEGTTNYACVGNKLSTTGTLTVDKCGYKSTSKCTDTCKLPNTCIGEICTPPTPEPTKPISKFTTSVTTGTVPLAVTFKNDSTGATSYLWDYGDGSTKSDTGLTHTYTAAGTYNVTLTAITATDVTTSTKQIVVTPGVFTTIPCTPSSCFDGTTCNATTGKCDPMVAPRPNTKCTDHICDPYTFTETPCGADHKYGTPILRSENCGYIAPSRSGGGDATNTKLYLYGAAALVGAGLLYVLIKKLKPSTSTTPLPPK